MDRPMDTAKPELIGYADRFSAAPGERLRFMVSTDLPRYEATLVRLIHGDVNPAGPGFKEEVIPGVLGGTYPGRKQVAQPGSYILVPDSPLHTMVESFTLADWIFPTTPALGRVQGILTKQDSGPAGYGLVVDARGALALRLGGEGGRQEEVSSGVPLRAGQWYFVAASYNAGDGAVRLVQRLQAPWPLPDASVVVEQTVQPVGSLHNQAPILIAAAASETTPSGRVVARGHYNGKIEAPCLFSRALQPEEIEALWGGASPRDVGSQFLVAAWDFAGDFASSRVRDTSRNGLDGRAVNMPMRAVTGRAWKAREVDFKRVPQQYGAIHFHDDDLEDAGWEADFELTVPEGLKSGIYAARLRGEGQEDYIPFYVRPPAGTASAAILVLAPTMTYLAYANERIIWREDIGETPVSERPADPNDLYLRAHPELGSSIYDLHSDGSGNAYSSRLRPIVTMRPKFRSYVVNAPRHFSADLYLIDWLEAKGFAYDVATDEDLHHEGQRRLAPYRVVITGSHPEYWTTPMRDALEAYLNAGGRLMYLGGNGFYWITAVDPERPHVIEVRRGYAGIRCWESAPGETYHSATGELGGLWRHRGQAPNQIAGVGFTSQGWDWSPATPGYVRLPDSFDPRAAFIFEGIGPEEVIGDFGLVMHTAAGDELDRADPALGTPPHALVLATSQGRHSDAYLLVVEDIPNTTTKVTGTTSPLIRADMVYFELPRGGAVFSVGSICWLGSLSHHRYVNNVSRITENVLRRFAS